MRFDSPEIPNYRKNPIRLWKVLSNIFNEFEKDEEAKEAFKILEKKCQKEYEKERQDFKKREKEGVNAILSLYGAVEKYCMDHSIDIESIYHFRNLQKSSVNTRSPLDELYKSCYKACMHILPNHKEFIETFFIVEEDFSTFLTVKDEVVRYKIFDALFCESQMKFDVVGLKFWKSWMYLKEFVKRLKE